MEKINYGKETLKLIEQGFVVQESELRRCQEDHIEANYTIDLFNKKRRLFISAKSKVSFDKCAARLEKYVLSRLQYEEEQQKPLKTLMNKIKELNDKEFYNKTNSKGKVISHNGYSLIFSAYYDTNKPKIEICYLNAGNTLIDFEPLSKNSVLNNEGNIHINSNNYTNKFSETIGKLLGYISDYLYTDLNIRKEELKEINSKFISNPYKFPKESEDK
ncbi:hypothetical protein [Staphylococcus haemolyticus]|uniref:hypothetical protein n=1 Tax=Staphylococcus haemolyticus TaxID=1283 RepID=UPI002ACE0EB0|nr:hypothetical protein [Staphylococcus haemolyticus]